MMSDVEPSNEMDLESDMAKEIERAMLRRIRTAARGGSLQARMWLEERGIHLGERRD